MKIALIDPNQPSENKTLVRRCYEYEPLGLEYIASYLTRLGHEVVILRQLEKDTETISTEVCECNPDIVGFTVLTYNYYEARRIAGGIKKSKPSVVTVFGGYHPTAEPGIVLNPEIDFCVIGEGEKTFAELVGAVSDKKDWSQIEGIAYADNGEVRVTPRRSRITDLTGLPLPLRTESILNDSKILGLMAPPPSKQKNVVMISCSRGCPNNCDYCSSETIWGTEVIYRSPESILDEIIQCRNQFGANTFFFCDLTFNANKKWVMEFCDLVINAALKMNWFCLCTINRIDKEMIEIMARAGCRKIAFGIEAFDYPSFDMMKSFRVPSLEQINSVLSLCDINNIFTKAYFLIGRPDEDLGYLESFKDALLKLQVDEVTIFYYTVFPGTRAFVTYQEFIACDDLSKYDLISQPILENSQVARDIYVNLRTALLQEFYESASYQNRILAKMNRCSEIAEAYEEFFMSLESDGFLISKQIVV